MAKTIIISITTIICTLLICFTVLKCSEMNRYVSYDAFNIPSVLDHKTGEIYSINTTNKKIIETNLLNKVLTYSNYIEEGSLPISTSNILETKEEYLKKVENGTNTKADDRRAEINGWVTE